MWMKSVGFTLYMVTIIEIYSVKPARRGGLAVDKEVRHAADPRLAVPQPLRPHGLLRLLRADRALMSDCHSRARAGGG